jgi:GT2 family glycosyltransferase
MIISIGIASAGRPGPLLNLLNYLSSVNLDYRKVIICTPLHSSDLPHLNDKNVLILKSPFSGLCYQRNIILSALKEEDFVLFLDDDFLPRKDYIKNLTCFLKKRKEDVALVTGNVVADGVTKGGFSFEAGVGFLNNSFLNQYDSCFFQVFNAYGCNMAVNMKMVREHNLKFDESLPLYGWLEDIEFSLQIKSYGKILKVSNLIGVHLGAKEGRQSACRLGYSQVINPFYIAAKHNLSARILLKLLGFRIFKNIFYGLFFNNEIRRKRAKGNLLAFFHVIQGKIFPQRILDLKA